MDPILYALNPTDPSAKLKGGEKDDFIRMGCYPELQSMQIAQGQKK